MTVAEDLIRALGPDRVLTSDDARTARRHDYWMVSNLRDRQGRGAPMPACVVRPASVADVQATVRHCVANRIPLIPFGQGSGVVGGVIAGPDAVLLDLGALNRVRAIDPVNLTASFDAGMNGLAAEEAVAALAERMGLAPLPGTIVQHWLGHRNHVPGWDQILDRGIVADTVEVSAPWDRIGAVYDAATTSVAEIPGCLAASAHSSHVYRSGLNLYFTFAIRPDAEGDMEAAYFESWKRIMAATAAAGGSLSHHHGIGRVRRDWMDTELGTSGVTLLQTLKAALDPAGVMNPGVLVPDRPGGEAR